VTRLVRVRDDNVLEIYDTAGRLYLEVHPGYEEIMGPCIHLYRIGITTDPAILCTIRLPTVIELVRKLPVVIAAARRLQNGAGGSTLARTQQTRRSPAK
jgi:hypothetical protein